MGRTEGSSIRWQSIAIEQLGYAVGLILSFSAATLGFSLSIVKDCSYRPTCWSKPFMLISDISLMLSIGLGLWCVINRLSDFRKTRSIAKDREDWTAEHVSDVEINKLLQMRREETDRLGKATWTLFRWQVGTFFCGTVALAIAFAIAYCSKIF